MNINANLCVEGNHKTSFVDVNANPRFEEYATALPVLSYSQATNGMQDDTALYRFQTNKMTGMICIS